MQELRGENPNHLLPTTQVPHWISDTLTLPFKKKILIIYKESQSINEVSPISSGAGRVTFHYPARRLAIREPQSSTAACTVLPCPDPTHPFLQTHPASACGFIPAVGRRGWQLLLLARCHLGWVTAGSRQTALSENHRLPHVRAKLTSVSLTFSAINTHRVLVSGIKIHKSKAESMK